MKNTKYNEKFKQSIVGLYNSGKSSTRICKEYEMTCSTLHKITHILQNKGYEELSVNRVSRIMKQLDIRAVTIRKFRDYRSKRHKYSELKNLVNQNFSAQIRT
ncbi:MAG: transposase [Oscillospiraceae bacterium]